MQGPTSWDRTVPLSILDLGMSHPNSLTLSGGPSLRVKEVLRWARTLRSSITASLQRVLVTVEVAAHCGKRPPQGHEALCLQDEGSRGADFGSDLAVLHSHEARPVLFECPTEGTRMRGDDDLIQRVGWA